MAIFKRPQIGPPWPIDEAGSSSEHALGGSTGWRLDRAASVPIVAAVTVPPCADLTDALAACPSRPRRTDTLGSSSSW